MQSKGIKALILAESPDIYQKNIPDTYLPFVQSYLIDSGILTNTDVYGVDLYNEPSVTNANVTTLANAAERIKAAYPDTRVTVGWWGVATNVDNKTTYIWTDYAAGKNFDSFIDFYSIHMYGFDKKTSGVFPDPYNFTKTFITSVKNQLQTTKPILIEEFGAANGEAVSDQETIGSPELQANTLNGVYQALTDMQDKQILGTVAYQTQTRTSSPDAWALMKNHGSYLFPAAYVIQKYATGTTESNITLPMAPVPDDILLKKSDANKTIVVRNNDYIGIKLSLDSSQSYYFSFSDPLFSVH
jgi:hypothetical protein